MMPPRLPPPLPFIQDHQPVPPVQPPQMGMGMPPMGGGMPPEGGGMPPMGGGMMPPEAAGVQPPEDVQNMDFPPLPVPAPPGEPMGEDESGQGGMEGNDGTAELLAQVIANIGKRYGQGGM